MCSNYRLPVATDLAVDFDCEPAVDDFEPVAYPGYRAPVMVLNRAGTRLGLRAARDPLALQARLAAGVQESDLLPDVSDLPPTMAEAEFKRRFGGVDGEGTRQLRREIEARLDRLPLLSAVR